MKNVILMFVFSICISLGVSFGQQPEPFVNTEKNYSIQFPSSWVYSYDKNSLTSALAACDSTDTANMLMVTTGTTGALSLNEAFNVTKRNMQLGKKNPLSDAGDIVLNNSNAKWCVYTTETQSGTRKVKMYILKKGARQYTIQAVLLPGDFDSGIELFDSVIATFTLTDN